MYTYIITFDYYYYYYYFMYVFVFFTFPKITNLMHNLFVLHRLRADCVRSQPVQYTAAHRE
jgi:hypothetical protein